jgi:hypothetical protein
MVVHATSVEFRPKCLPDAKASVKSRLDNLDRALADAQGDHAVQTAQGWPDCSRLCTLLFHASQLSESVRSWANPSLSLSE